MTLDGVKGPITIRFLRKRGDLRWRAIEYVLVIIIITIIIIIIITYSSGLDTDVEKLYTIFIVNVNSLNFLLPLYIQTRYVRKRSSPCSTKTPQIQNMEWEFYSPTHIHSTKTYTVMIADFIFYVLLYVTLCPF